MSADNVAVLVAAGAACAAAVGSLVAAALLRRRLRDLSRLVGDLRREAVPLVRDARVAAEEAATEMVRVGDVLGSAEAVSATVDSASRLAYRAFANPVVKTLAFSTGLGAAVRRLVGVAPAADLASAPRGARDGRRRDALPLASAPVSKRHRRRSRVRR